MKTALSLLFTAASVSALEVVTNDELSTPHQILDGIFHHEYFSAPIE